MADKCLLPSNGNRTWLIKYYFFYQKRGVILKELGEYLKKVREDNGVEIEEAAEDLKISNQILSNIECGNTRVFRDILELKENVIAYAKYLGLDCEKITDEFNNFMFEHTSKISLNDILEAEKASDEKNKKVVRSPYTKPHKKTINVKIIKIFLGFVLFLILVVLAIILIKTFLFPDETINTELKNKINMEDEIYECA